MRTVLAVTLLVASLVASVRYARADLNDVAKALEAPLSELRRTIGRTP